MVKDKIWEHYIDTVAKSKMAPSEIDRMMEIRITEWLKERLDKKQEIEDAIQRTERVETKE